MSGTQGAGLRRVDYADSFAVDLPEQMSAPAFCRCVLRSAPRWLDLLLTARDSVAGRIGFHTQERNYGGPVDVAVGNKFGPLVVRSVAPDEVVCGDADRHLAFRAVFRTTGGDRPRGTFTTQVQLNDWIGRAYFAVVRPFHRRLIPVLVSAPFPGRAVPVEAASRGAGEAPGERR